MDIEIGFKTHAANPRTKTFPLILACSALVLFRLVYGIFFAIVCDFRFHRQILYHRLPCIREREIQGEREREKHRIK